MTADKLKTIMEMAKFLEILGYKKTYDEHSVEYTLNNIIISICVPPFYSEESDISVRFIKENQCFSISWIARVRDGIHKMDDIWSEIEILIQYLETHYYQITNYQYCVESNKLVDKYVEEHQAIFEREVQRFLSKN